MVYATKFNARRGDDMSRVAALSVLGYAASSYSSSSLDSGSTRAVTDFFKGAAVKPQGHEGAQRHTDGTVNDRDNTEH